MIDPAPRFDVYASTTARPVPYSPIQGCNSCKPATTRFCGRFPVFLDAPKGISGAGNAQRLPSGQRMLLQELLGACKRPVAAEVM